MTRKPRIEIARADNGQWLWRLKGANHRKQTTAGETFPTKWKAIRAAKAAQVAMAQAGIVVRDDA